MKVKPHNQYELQMDINEPFDAVFIIGNGFDKSLGLKTSYVDYVDSPFFAELIAQGNDFAQYLINQKQLRNWIDIENELSKYSISDKSLNSNFYENFNDLSENLIKYLESLDYSNFDETSFVFKILEKLSNYKTLILDFNYTITTSVLLEKINLADINVKHIKVHGTLKDKNIIFGVDDKSKIRDEHIFLKKSVHKNYVATNFNDFLQQAKSIGVFGHSLGETDHMYFSDYFAKSTIKGNKMSDKDIFIYFYKENGRLEIHKQLDILTNKSISKFKQNNDVKFYDTNE